MNCDFMFLNKFPHAFQRTHYDGSAGERTILLCERETHYAVCNLIGVRLELGSWVRTQVLV